MPKTVLLTGISGFLAKRIAFDLLEAGHSVTGSLRTPDRAVRVIAALRAKGLDDAALSRLRFVKLDLTSDKGWDDSMAGIDAVIHTASPFPLVQPKDQNVLIRPTVDGTVRALRAAEAAGVHRFILTSSMEAMMHGTKSGAVTEKDWSDVTAPTVSINTKSKTLAERAAWGFVANHPQMKLTVINPGLMLGVPMDRETGSSIGVIARILRGRDPAMPDVYVPIADIADVSAAHLKALEDDTTTGQRYIIADSFVAIPEMARILKEAFPKLRISTKIAPRLLVRLVAMFDGEFRLILPWIAWQSTLDNTKARKELGLAITPAKSSILATGRFLVER